jgi:hypothetical protein
MAENYDPAKVPCPPEYHILPADNTLPLNGPGGKSTNTENNEKGILETNLATLTDPTYAALGCDHDSYKQGIYTTNSVGDND